MPRPTLLFRFRRTIAGKLLLVVLPCLLVGMAAMYAGFETYGRHERIAALKARLDSFAVTQGASLVKPLWEFDEDQLDRLVRSYARVPELLAVEIRDAKGAVVATARGDGTDGHGEVFRRTLDLVQHAPDGDYTVGRLSVAFHDGVVRRELAGQRTAGAVLLLGAFVLLAGGMLFAVRRFVATPLRELQDSLHRNATLETRELLHWRHQDELGEVVYAYNQLLGEVNQHIGDVYRLAFYDPLTGLPNRRLLEDRLGHAIALAERQGRGVAVLFIDIDRFKVINDTLGHKLGDDVLRTVAERLRGSLRSMDTITRWGGDEFVVIIEATETGASAGQASSISEKLLDLIGQPVSIGDNLLRISASVGISLFPQDGRDVTTLIKNADMALYEAKGAGRNAFRFFDQAMNLRAVRRLEIEALLRQAIERDELELHYQPKLATAGGRLEGVEALVRWRRGPELVPPDQFIPVAEESDLIIDIGRWVFARACAQIQAWRAAGLGDIQVAINLSPRHLRCAQDVDDLAAIVERSGVPPSLIEIELTESCIMEDPERAADFLRHLRDRGFAIAIDDFGTGYSSLSHLRRLPITALKIDRSFVNAIEDATEDAEIVRTIIAMANTLSLGIVAEGVETRGQLDFLCQAGCAVVQGYYFARPMPPRDFERWMRGRFRLGLRNLGDSWANGAAEDRAFGGAGEGLGMAYP